jgi:hypothetical protein
LSEFYIVHAERISVSPTFAFELVVFGDTEFKEADQQPTGRLAAFARIAGSDGWTRIGQEGPQVPTDALNVQAQIALPVKEVSIVQISDRAWLVRDADRVYRFDPACWYRPLGFAADRPWLSPWDRVQVAEGDLIPYHAQ